SSAQNRSSSAVMLSGRATVMFFAYGAPLKERMPFSPVKSTKSVGPHSAMLAARVVLPEPCGPWISQRPRSSGTSSAPIRSTPGMFSAMSLLRSVYSWCAHSVAHSWGRGVLRRDRLSARGALPRPDEHRLQVVLTARAAGHLSPAQLGERAPLAPLREVPASLPRLDRTLPRPAHVPGRVDGGAKVRRHDVPVERRQRPLVPCAQRGRVAQLRDHALLRGV